MKSVKRKLNECWVVNHLHSYRAAHEMIYKSFWRTNIVSKSISVFILLVFKITVGAQQITSELFRLNYRMVPTIWKKRLSKIKVWKITSLEKSWDVLKFVINAVLTNILLLWNMVLVLHKDNIAGAENYYCNLVISLNYFVIAYVCGNFK